MSDQLNQVAASLQEATWKLEKEKEQVETLLRQKKKFMADVSHELRTPVAILKGCLEVGEMKGELGNQDLFRRELDRLQQMIDELFMLATKDEQDENEPFLRELLHPDGLLQEVFETFQPIAWREKKISLELSLLESDRQIIADPVRLRQILHNLLRNALRHTPEGGLVVSAEEDQAVVLLIVADTGSGMCEEEVAHVFQRYYRGRVSPAGSMRERGSVWLLSRNGVSEWGPRYLCKARKGKEHK